MLTINFEKDLKLYRNGANEDRGLFLFRKAVFKLGYDYFDNASGGGIIDLFVCRKNDDGVAMKLRRIDLKSGGEKVDKIKTAKEIREAKQAVKAKKEEIDLANSQRKILTAELEALRVGFEDLKGQARKDRKDAIDAKKGEIESKNLEIEVLEGELDVLRQSTSSEEVIINDYDLIAPHIENGVLGVEGLRLIEVKGVALSEVL